MGRSISAWSSMIAVLVLVMGCSSDDGSSTTTTIVSPVRKLQGTWSDGTTTVTLAGCAVGEECGRLERIDDNREHCVYTLTYVGQVAAGLELETGAGNSFGCGYSGWSKGVVLLTPVTEDTIEVALVSIPRPQTATLTRVSESS